MLLITLGGYILYEPTVTHIFDETLRKTSACTGTLLAPQKVSKQYLYKVELDTTTHHLLNRCSFAMHLTAEKQT